MVSEFPIMRTIKRNLYRPFTMITITRIYSNVIISVFIYTKVMMWNGDRAIPFGLVIPHPIVRAINWHTLFINRKC
jgi:hypothetical protein